MAPIMKVTVCFLKIVNFVYEFRDQALDLINERIYKNFPDGVVIANAAKVVIEDE